MFNGGYWFNFCLLLNFILSNDIKYMTNYLKK